MLDCSKKQSNKFICAGHGTVQYVLSLDEVGKERLTSHECAWEKQIDCNRQTTLRMDRHETIVAERCETFRYYCIVGVLG